MEKVGRLQEIQIPVSVGRASQASRASFREGPDDVVGESAWEGGCQTIHVVNVNHSSSELQAPRFSSPR